MLWPASSHPADSYTAMPTKPDKLIERTRSTKSQTDQEMIAESLVGMPIQAAMTVTTYWQAPFTECMSELTGELHRQVIAVNKSDMSKAEGLLVAQAHTLDAIFNRLAQRAQAQEYLPNVESLFRLALRAQNQCRATLETLATIKNPPNVAFVKQANIAHNQQVNNGPQAYQPPAIQPPAIDSTPQLEHTHSEYLDTGTAPAAGRTNSAVATVARIHRPTNHRGEG